MTKDTNLLSQIAQSPLLLGDDIVDAWQGAYWLMKNSELLDAVPITGVRCDCPVVAVGSGPSLDEHLDELKDKQDGLCIVAGHSSHEKLEKAGIKADFFTPIERVDFQHRMPTHKIEAAYAGLPVVPHEHKRCAVKYAVGNFDHLYNWAGMREAMILTGLTTGVAACGVGCCLAADDSMEKSARPVWLVGHDLASGHYNGYKYGGDVPDDHLMVECYDGEKRASCMTWLTVRDMLAQWASVFDVRTACSKGAKIHGVRHDPLPSVGKSKHITVGKPSLGARKHVEQMRSGVLEMWDGLASGIEKAQNLGQIECQYIAKPEWHELVIYLLRSYFFQFSIHRKMCLASDDALLKWAKEAFANVHSSLRNSVKEVACGS